jgi:argininosuccinate lyase
VQGFLRALAGMPIERIGELQAQFGPLDGSLRTGRSRGGEVVHRAILTVKRRLTGYA